MLFKYDNLGASLTQCVVASREWLDSHRDVKDRLSNCLSGFEELQFVVPLEISEDNKNQDIEGSPFPFIPPWLHVFYEADQELDSIMTTCFCGLYKDSLRAIRSLLELNLLGLYFFAKQDYKHFRSWLGGLSD